MDNFVPGLRENILSLTESLRGLLYVICVAGFMLHVQRGRNDPESPFRPFIRATCVVACIALLPQGFGAVEKTLLAVANVVNEGYTEHPMRTAEKMRASNSIPCPMRLGPPPRMMIFFAPVGLASHSTS